MDLRGKTILITGAARGIGAESARQLSARGARIALVGLEPEELARVAQQCGPDAAAFEADVTDSEALAGVVESVVERFGGIDVVMANAGVAATGFVRSMDPEAFERTIEVNLLGVFRTVRACLPHVIERRGYVLVIASLAAASHGPGMAAYSASKAGAEAFGNSLRAEVAHLGVDVGVGYFAFLDTDMVRGGDSHPVFGKLRVGDTRAVGQDLPAVGRGAQGRGGHRGARAHGGLPRLGPGDAAAPRDAGAAARTRLGRADRRDRRGLRPRRGRARRGGRLGAGGRGRPGRPAPRDRATCSTMRMAKRDPRMVPLGYGKFVRADRVFALVPIEGSERRDGRRTYVHVDGLSEPVVASRSERAILADVETALAEAAGLPRRRRVVATTGQESLL